MINGIIKWFDAKKGFGFVMEEFNPSKEYFLHIKNLELPEGERVDIGRAVEFETATNEKGEMAVNAKLTGFSLKKLRRIWGERNCSVSSGRNANGTIGYKIIDKENNQSLLGDDYNLTLPEVECYYYA
ncbi:cold shock domain-containing protein [Clostridium sp. HBUAS56010]|uniref:cold-shock protein n=1 Tax=Clostridium sp. HBUAS56010 TaxID=2571127 RepID=UPI00163D6B13|nr:cold shock domain-containing protein [Clostridium sp. HBUAS56010]